MTARLANGVRDDAFWMCQAVLTHALKPDLKNNLNAAAGQGQFWNRSNGNRIGLRTGRPARRRKASPTNLATNQSTCMPSGTETHQMIALCFYERGKVSRSFVFPGQSHQESPIAAAAFAATLRPFRRIARFSSFARLSLQSQPIHDNGRKLQ